MQAYITYTVGMKCSQNHLQYTIRGVPLSLDKVIHRNSKQNHKSLNKTLLEMLTKGAELKETELFNDLDSFFGSWVEDPAVELALLDQRKIDAGLWK